MELDDRRRSTLGYDTPLYRDWLFVFACVVSATGGLVRLVRGDVWWEALASVSGSVFLIGVLLESMREVVRGYREVERH